MLFGLFGKKKSDYKEKSLLTKTVQIPKIIQQGIDIVIDDKGTVVTFKFGNAQHIGSRKQQEDSFGFSNITSSNEIAEKGILAVLADGMGGLSHGNEISQYVVSAAITMFANFDYSMPFPQQLENMVVKINREVSENFSKNGKSNAGSTMAVVFIYKTKLFWACVGDSRIYIFRDELLHQINEDHDYFNKMLVDFMYGNIALQNAKAHSEKDALTSYIGNENLPYIDCNSRGFALHKNDTIVLCSDGVYNSIGNLELSIHLQENPQPAAEKIVKSIVRKKIPHQDNITILTINYN